MTRYLSIPGFGAVLGLYSEEFMSIEEFSTLSQDIHQSTTLYWTDIVAIASLYNPSHSNATYLPLTLRYIHAILAHSLISRRESMGVVGTYDAYFLWSMAMQHPINVAYFVAFTCCHHSN